MPCSLIIPPPTISQTVYFDTLEQLDIVTIIYCTSKRTKSVQSRHERNKFFDSYKQEQAYWSNSETK